MKMTHGNYPAPLKILEVIRTGLVDGDHEGYEMETRVTHIMLSFLVDFFHDQHYSIKGLR